MPHDKFKDSRQSLFQEEHSRNTVYLKLLRSCLTGCRDPCQTERYYLTCLLSRSCVSSQLAHSVRSKCERDAQSAKRSNRQRLTQKLYSKTMRIITASSLEPTTRATCKSKAQEPVAISISCGWILNTDQVFDHHRLCVCVCRCLQVFGTKSLYEW